MLLGNQGQSSYLQTKIQASTAVSNNFETNLKLHERVAIEVNLLELAITEGHFEKKARYSKKSNRNFNDIRYLIGFRKPKRTGH